ncbi:putative nucleosome assembly protein [Trypanosoma cruzi]|uniref:Nucleosome assembly protein, putative n=2 Tax=Trypanosoma cruzi TaxID=5693 RepID=Q4DSA7_TRYCC|nr:nucleosome assembly protein, putative [Trypanosoma cruzi]EAN95410.1 nucleosome assembly protein, putative [Trypanosoma cruzi]PWV17402.1 putative nucleosome assembly protein [Trypanosoma cruzi]RNC47593.1 nucleosome assembly protein [Trypanosoma cruzi]|eukprot:XP_817261.1 nucleosome assembly protein [Trypanosoma cruzi strain CL Brener]
MPVGRNVAVEHDDDVDISTPFHKYFNPNYSAEFMSKLPERIQQRAKVLLHYHEEYEKLRKNFEEKETALRRQYDELYAPLHDHRKEIITGSREPTDEEVAKGFPSEHEGQVEIKVTEAEADKSVVGIPGFWLRVLRGHVLSDSLIEEHDEEVLNHLKDIRSGVLDGSYGSFAVVFVFGSNDFFQEESLVLSVKHNDDGVKITRTPPTWKPGKDVTVETVTKKLGGKRGKGAKTKTFTVPRNSFFNVFKEMSKDKAKAGGDGDEEDDDEDEDEEEQIEQLLNVLHTSIIPCAVNFYTGEAPDGSSDLESADFDDDDDEEDEEEEEEEEDEDEEEEELPKRGPKGRGGRGGNKPANTQQECKQQ